MALPALEEPADGGTGSAAVDAAEAPFAQELLKAAAPGGARVQGQAEPRFLEPTAQPSLQHTVEAAAAAPREGGALHSSTGEGTHGHGIRGREIVSQLAQEVVRHGAAGNGEITIRLRPEELGELRLNIRLENQKLHVDVVAENRGVRDVLLDNVQTLRESLERQNVRMERFDVSYGGSGNGPGQGFGQGGRAEQGRQLLYDSPAGGDLDAHPIPGAGSQADEGESLLVDVRL
jgi:flagellar hook-length control protein FliK